MSIAAVVALALATIPSYLRFPPKMCDVGQILKASPPHKDAFGNEIIDLYCAETGTIYHPKHNLHHFRQLVMLDETSDLVSAPDYYCDEFAFCYAVYDGKAYRIPWPKAPIPKELQ